MSRRNNCIYATLGACHRMWWFVWYALHTRQAPSVPYSYTVISPADGHITKDEKNLRIFERQILRKIFGPVNIHNIWRIRNNTEIDKLTDGADIVRFIKAQRIKWLGHIQRMDQAKPPGS